MIIQAIGTSALSMYIDEEDLSKLGLDPRAVGKREAESLLRTALTENALPQWEAAALEVFPGKDSLLVFVRRKADKPCYFLFQDAQALIDACLQCPEALQSSLTAAPSGYILTIYPFAGESAPAVLSEYGDQADGYLILHLIEQNGELLKQNAIGTLQKYFR